MSEIDERIARIQKNKSVKGVIVLTYQDLKDAQDNHTPEFVKSTFPKDSPHSARYGVALARVAMLARDLVRDLDQTNDLKFVRMSVGKFEFAIAPDKNYFLIVVQEPE